jgi:hypothetical protein
LIFEKSQAISLKNHPEYSEKWLQTHIVNDTGLLGLGDLTVKDVERRQPRAGRLDLLLSDPDSGTRYEVELQLGATDEAHIIRTIEYWDIEKNRYPMFEHIAVIVAEDITSRFLNVISLFNRSIPLIAIQLNAFQVGEYMTLSSTTVLDLVQLTPDDEDEALSPPTDRGYWESKGSPKTLEIADEVLKIIQSEDPGVEFKYNKHYIGLGRNGMPDNYVTFKPRKEVLGALFRIPRNDGTTEFIESSGLDVLEYDKRWGHYRARLTQSDLENRRDAITELIRQAKNGLSEPESQD